MNQSLKLLAALLALITPAISTAQELHTFSNGEVADAEKINENFQYVLENASSSGGCSAEQDGSSVVITCADGTSGVLASKGTVVTYPIGASAVPDVSTLPTGQLVVVDANDIVLAKLREGANGNYLVELQTSGGYVLARIINEDTEEVVTVGIYSQPTIYFQEMECSGQAFVENPSYLMLGPDGGYITNSSATQKIAQVTQSKYRGGVCEKFEYADNSLYTVFQFVLAQEITDAGYPARAYQLP